MTFNALAVEPLYMRELNPTEPASKLSRIQKLKALSVIMRYIKNLRAGKIDRSLLKGEGLKENGGIVGTYLLLLFFCQFICWLTSRQRCISLYLILQ